MQILEVAINVFICLNCQFYFQLDDNKKLIKTKFMDNIRANQNPYWAGVIDVAFDYCSETVDTGIFIFATKYVATFTKSCFILDYSILTYSKCKGVGNGRSVAIIQCIRMRMIEVIYGVIRKIIKKLPFFILLDVP